MGLTEVDDFQVVLEAMTTPEQQPALHFWKSHPDPGSLSAEEIYLQGLDVGRAMAPALEAVIANHLESRTPVILEGDFIHPGLAARSRFLDEPNDARVHAVFLTETDEAQLQRNFVSREPELGEQRTRARVSRLYGEWLQGDCERHGVQCVASRPWATLFDRLVAAVGSSSTFRP